eukprot:1159951-Pleurochrysis_carterae.AAC.1
MASPRLTTAPRAVPQSTAPRAVPFPTAPRAVPSPMAPSAAPAALVSSTALSDPTLDAETDPQPRSPGSES